MRRRAALRTREGVGKWARALAPRGDTYGTKAAMSKLPYPHGRRRNGLLYRIRAALVSHVIHLCTLGCDSPKCSRHLRSARDASGIKRVGAAQS